MMMLDTVITMNLVGSIDINVGFKFVPVVKMRPALLH